MVHDHMFHGEHLFLVQPQNIGAKFTQHNRIFRSSLWNATGDLVSASFFKFVNYGENPDNFPVPTSLRGCEIVTKVDGSLLCICKYKGHLTVRTRGTIDASQIDNGF